MTLPPPISTLFPYTTLFRSAPVRRCSRTGGLMTAPFEHVAIVGLGLIGSSIARAAREALPGMRLRSEEHTSELQSPCNLVCRLLLEKKKRNKIEDVYSDYDR